MSEDEKTHETRLKHDVRVWEAALTTQMPFNELLIRSRTTVVTVAMAVIGATLIAFKETSITFSICTKEVHFSVVILAIGIVFLGTQFGIDYCYYFRLLLGAVQFTTEMDNKYREEGMFGLTTCINRSISQERARRILFAYYLVPIILGIVLIVLILLCMGKGQEGVESLGQLAGSK